VLTILGTRIGATPAQVALTWLLDLAPNDLLIPGTRNRPQRTGDIRAASVQMDHPVREVLRRHFPADTTQTRDVEV